MREETAPASASGTRARVNLALLTVATALVGALLVLWFVLDGTWERRDSIAIITLLGLTASGWSLSRRQDARATGAVTIMAVCVILAAILRLLDLLL